MYLLFYGVSRIVDKDDEGAYANPDHGGHFLQERKLFRL